jgi:hypothetical protein
MEKSQLIVLNFLALRNLAALPQSAQTSFVVRRFFDGPVKHESVVTGDGGPLLGVEGYTENSLVDV